MKNLDLMSYDVVEMTQQEMLAVEGGTIWNKIVDVAETVVDWICEAAGDVWKFMKEHNNDYPPGGARFNI